MSLATDEAICVGSFSQLVEYVYFHDPIGLTGELNTNEYILQSHGDYQLSMPE